MKDSKEYTVNPGITKEIAQLEEKNQYDMYATRISVIGSSRQIVDSLSASFNIVSAQNSFKSRLSNFKLTQFRFIPKENLFKIFNHNAFGSLLNIRELTSLIQLSQFQNLSKIRNDEKNLDVIETKAEIVPKVVEVEKPDKSKEPINSKETSIEKSDEKSIDSQKGKSEKLKPKQLVTAIQPPKPKPERVKAKKFPKMPEVTGDNGEVQE
jgi:hypothetical protein